MSFRAESSCRVLSLQSIASHRNLRCDAKYRLFWGLIGENLYPNSQVPCYPIRAAALPLRRKKLKKGALDSEHELVELEDVEKRTGLLISSSPVSELQSDKLLFGQADVLTTRLRPYLGKTLLNLKERPFAGTTEWIPIKVDAARIPPRLLAYFLLSPRYTDNAHRLLSGKEHPRIAESDILSLRVPFLSAQMQRRLLAETAALEQQIDENRRHLRPEQEIIDEVLCGEFGYPLAEHRSRQRERFFSKPLVAMAGGFTLRNSSRFHHPAFEFVERFFAKVPHEHVRRFLSVPIRLGATAKKEDFVENGDAFYVHPGATKTQGVIQSEDCYEVVSAFFDEHKRRVGLRPGDVIVNRSGEALGKVALFDGAFPAVASDFTMRVRFNEDANPRFMWYFFRSVMFQAQIARELRGASMPNVFPGQIERMLVVTRSRSAQDALAQIISDELEKLRAGKARIAAAQRRIHELIDAAVESGAALTP